ncbi:unnamed protein product [Amoebophrya sp. A25]|nr:unnamed protein product [Amoebophrya sp. A25]|eukprot:GSA25T00005254001.1
MSQSVRLRKMIWALLGAGAWPRRGFLGVLALATRLRSGGKGKNAHDPRVEAGNWQTTGQNTNSAMLGMDVTTRSPVSANVGSSKGPHRGQKKPASKGKRPVNQRASQIKIGSPHNGNRPPRLDMIDENDNRVKGKGSSSASPLVHLAQEGSPSQAITRIFRLHDEEAKGKRTRPDMNAAPYVVPIANPIPGDGGLLLTKHRTTGRPQTRGPAALISRDEPVFVYSQAAPDCSRAPSESAQSRQIASHSHSQQAHAQADGPDNPPGPPGAHFSAGTPWPTPQPSPWFGNCAPYVGGAEAGCRQVLAGPAVSGRWNTVAYSGYPCALPQEFVHVMRSSHMVADYTSTAATPTPYPPTSEVQTATIGPKVLLEAGQFPTASAVDSSPFRSASSHGQAAAAALFSPTHARGDPALAAWRSPSTAMDTRGSPTSKSPISLACLLQREWNSNASPGPAGEVSPVSSPTKTNHKSSGVTTSPDSKNQRDHKDKELQRLHRKSSGASLSTAGVAADAKTEPLLKGIGRSRRSTATDTASCCSITPKNIFQETQTEEAIMVMEVDCVGRSTKYDEQGNPVAGAFRASGRFPSKKKQGKGRGNVTAKLLQRHGAEDGNLQLVDAGNTNSFSCIAAETSSTADVLAPLTVPAVPQEIESENGGPFSRQPSPDEKSFVTSSFAEGLQRVSAQPS